MSNSSIDHNITGQAKEYENLLCHDLPSQPRADMGKVLVTGASGYIGGRLVPELLARGYSLRVMVRAASPIYKEHWPEAEIVVADALNVESLRAALEDVDTAYYLIHSLLLGPKEFASADVQAARNFRMAAEEKKVKRIIYLGGLGDTHTQLSRHLQSRIQVAQELKKGKVPVTILRAAIIIGSGSASYEIIQNLVRKLPVILVPLWANTKCQPIAIRDVVKYLVGVLEIKEAAGKYFDIGGNDILNYQDMLRIRAQLMNKKAFFVPCFISNIRFYSYIESLVTPVPDSITRCLMEGLKNEVICQDNSIKEILPFQTMGYKEAIIRAMNREEQDNIHTRWSDAYPPAYELAMKLHECEGDPQYSVSYSLVTEKEASSLFQSICRVGGKGGWFANNWMWRLRGAIDRIFLGVGTSRGRKSQTTLKIDDVIDFWRTEDLQPNERLLLRAEMKLPGRAWLEFNIKDEADKRKLSIIAHYYTHSLWGKIYWYMFLPFHRLIFNDLIKQIEKRS
jgi:uncharacterized protein YbjT (DUF2867 family)